MVDISLSKGKAVRLETPGGGGYGNPYERKIETVLNDIKLGYISSDIAVAHYGVFINDDGKLNKEKTLSFRKDNRKTS